nr:immunoglobulin heavy chain junction region [Macaca mulatta]MOW33003.1 immunoglobulin heavy chain junction region [Macaca mulatta]MOW33076.1 immunoglobulin heavy chain junction region [Macaca mulatta]MOW33154.1 immunoglobulin heavy chain junction region [Macaca mulatta]
CARYCSGIYCSAYYGLNSW